MQINLTDLSTTLGLRVDVPDNKVLVVVLLRGKNNINPMANKYL